MSMRAAASATVSANAGSSAGRSSSTRIEPGSRSGSGRSGDGCRTANAPSTSAPMSATTRAVASARGLGGGGRAEPAAVERDAQVAAARHHGLSDVRLSGAERAVDTKQKQPVAGRGAEREHRLARLDVDEDLVPGGRSQRRAALAQRVGHANQSHCVDGVDREGRVRRIGRVQPGERVTDRVGVPAGIRAERVRQVVVRVQARPGAPMILELDEDRSLQHPAGGARSRHGESRAPSTCCERARARRAPAGRRRPGRGRERRRRLSRSARRPGRRSPRAGPERRPSHPRTESAPRRPRGPGGLPGVGSFIPTSWM